MSTSEVKRICINDVVPFPNGVKDFMLAQLSGMNHVDLLQELLAVKVEIRDCGYIYDHGITAFDHQIRQILIEGQWIAMLLLGHVKVCV